VDGLGSCSPALTLAASELPMLSERSLFESEG
jgi:hypothetical protein